MASITVRVYGFWRDRLGTDAITLRADSLDDALSQVEENYCEPIRRGLESEGVRLDGSMKDYGLILLNGTNIRNLKSTDLNDGDVIHVFPRAIGG